ncbi:MAG: beta strand repeat-containing protein, partial [Ferruginibacter sp.]
GTHKGAISIAINSSITETASAVLHQTGYNGTSDYSTVHVYPTVSGLTINGNLAGPLIDLSGANNVTLDGSVEGLGSTKDLIISNLSTSTTLGTSTIRFINAASNNTVKNCTIKGSSLSATTSFSTGGGILLFSTTATTGNNNNLIDNNNITNAGGNRPKTALYSYGTSGATNDGNTISNNMFYDFFSPVMSSAGIYLNSYTSAWNITGNTFYETTALAPTTLSTYYGIRAYSSSASTRGSGFTISDNFIGGNASDHTGTLTISSAQTHGFFGIDLWVGTTTTSSIQNNTIKNINYTTTAQTPFYGINISSGNVNIGTVTGNTIGSTTGNGSISLTSSTNFTISEGIKNGGSGTVNIQNNKIGGITIIGAASAGHSFYGIDASGGSSIISNNTIGSADAGTTNSIWASYSTTGTQNIYGIYSNGATPLTISRNMVSQLTNAATGSVGEVTGIKLSSAALTNNITNNIIILGGDTKTTIYGIYETGSSSSNSNLYFNTVYIAGTLASGTIKSYAL